MNDKVISARNDRLAKERTESEKLDSTRRFDTQSREKQNLIKKKRK